MKLYLCNAHGRGPGPDCATVCPECYASQKAAVGSDKHNLRFRKYTDANEAYLRTHSPEERAVAPAEPGPTPRSPAPAKGPRVAGIDPGSRYVAVTIADGDGPAMRYVASRTFIVGHAVERAVKVRPDGKPFASDSRWVVDDSDIGALFAEIIPWMAPFGVTRIGVEKSKVFRSGASESLGSAGGRAAALLTSQWVGGQLAGAFRCAGIPVSSMSSAEWRAAVKKATRSGKATPWGDALRKRYAGSLPSVSMRRDDTMPHDSADGIGAHEFDSSGVAAFLLTPATVAPRAPRVVQRSAHSIGEHAKRTAKRAEARKASGCTCKGRRSHAKTCPRYQPATVEAKQ